MRRKNVAPLIPELVPGPLWGKSAHKMLGSKAVWKRQIRDDTLANSNNCCSMCKSSKGRMTCHEKWGCDDRLSVATLSDLRFIARIAILWRTLAAPSNLDMVMSSFRISAQ
jgi:hypothetical protein